MGYSPLEGLTMGTRAGAIDGNAVLRLARERGIYATERLLNHESGLLALGGHSDVRVLHAEGRRSARFAIEHFVYWCIRHAGSMIAAMKGLDAVAFTGGIGENDAAVRAGIMQGLAWLGLSFEEAANVAHASHLHNSASKVEAYIVPAREERYIAAAALSSLGPAAPHSHLSVQGS
jgi:acetate kinase